MEFFTEAIYHYFPRAMINLIHQIDPEVLKQVIEIRLRANQPTLLVLMQRESMLSATGGLTDIKEKAYICRLDDIQKIVQMISKNSIYALEEELKLGFITIDGGHRVGLAGKAIMENGHLKALKNIGSLNFRIAKDVVSCSNQIIPYLVENEHILNTLLIAPPRAGKTTLLRDMIRSFSNGCNYIKGVQVGVVDERSELAAVKDGVPLFNVGMRTDVLDGCPKAEGILMLIRTMAPVVIVTDELGRKQDVFALCEALHAGVSVISSVHGRSVEDVAQRPYVEDLIKQRFFDRYVVLTSHPVAGTVEKIVNVKNDEILFDKSRW